MEQEINIKDPTPQQKFAKAVDDYMNNETEEVVPPEEWEPRSLEEALLGEWLELGHLRVGPLFLW